MALKAPRVRVSAYIRNVGRSMRYAVSDVVANYNPIVTDVAKQTKEAHTAVSNTMSKLTFNNISKATKEFMSTPNIVSNTLEDLKTGNWINKEREQAAEDSMFGGFDFDFDDEDWGDNDSDWGDDNFDSDDDDSVSSEQVMANDNQNTAKVVSTVNQVGAEMSKNIAYASARSAEYIVGHNTAASKALYDLNRTGFNQVSTILMNMDNTLANITKFGEPLAQHMQNSAVFYTKTTETLDSINANLQKLVDRTAHLDEKEKKAGSVKNGYDKIMSGDMFSPSAYMDFLKGNIKSQVDMVKGFADILTMSTGKKGENTSLASMVSKGIVEALIPKFTKDAMKDFNQALSNAFTNTVMGAGDKMRRSDNFLLGMLADVLFPSNTLKKDIDNSKYEKGPIPFDGYTKRAITNVIPTYLAKMTAAMTGDERYYDYEAGKFVTLEDVQKRKDERLMNAAERAGGNFRDAALKRTKDGSKVQQEVKDYFYNAFIHGDMDFYEIEKHKSDVAWLKKFGLSKASAQVILDTINAGATKGYRANSMRNDFSNFRRDVYAGRLDYTNRMNDLQSTGVNVEGNLTEGFSKFNEKFKLNTAEFHQRMYELTANIYNLLLTTGGLPKNAKKAGGSKTNQDFRYFDISRGTFRDPANQSEQTPAGSNAPASAGAPVAQASDYDKYYSKMSPAEQREYDSLGSQDEKDEYLKSWKARNASKVLMEEGRRKASSKFANTKAGQALEKSKFLWEQPFAIITDRLNDVTNSLNKIFLGSDREERKRILDKAKIPDDTVDILFKDLPNGKTIWYCVNAEGEKTRTVTQEQAEAWFDKKKHSIGGVVNSIKNYFKGGWQNFGNTLMAQLFRANTTRQQYLADARAGISNSPIGGEDSGTGWLWALTGGDSGVKDKVEKGKNIVRGAAGVAKDISKEKAGEAADKLLSTKAAGMVAHGIQNISAGLTNAFNALIGNPEEDKEKIIDKMKDIAPELYKGRGGAAVGAIAGAGVSLLSGAFLGPIGGAAVGAGIGLIAKSQKAQDFLFGKGDPDSPEYQKGVLGPVGKLLKKNIPAIKSAGAGGLLGLIGGTFMGSPVLGMYLGAATGFVANSEKAKTFLFGGEDENGNKVEGLFGDIKGKILNPLDDLVHNMGNNINGFLRRTGVRVRNTLKALGKKLTKAVDDFKNSDNWLKKGLGYLLGFGVDVARLPGKVIGGAVQGLSNRARKTALNKGNAVYDRRLGRNLTAKERLSLRAQMGKNGKIYGANNFYSKVDYQLANMSPEEQDELLSMSDDDLKAKFGANDVQLSMIKSNIRAESKLRKKSEQEKEDKDPTYAPIRDIKEILMKKFEIDPKKKGNKEGREVKSDAFGQYEVDADGNIVNDDSATRARSKKIEEFTKGITSIPVIGTLLKGIGSKLGFLKDKLIGSKEEPGILRKLMGSLFGENGLLSGLFSFISGSKIGTTVKTVLSNASLGTILGGIGLPAALVLGFSGALDNLFEKIGGLSIFKGNDTKNAMSDERTTVTDPETGETRHVGEDNRLSKRLLKNVVSGAIMGRGSLLTGTIKLAKKSWAKMLGKTDDYAAKTAARKAVFKEGGREAVARLAAKNATNALSMKLMNAMDKIVDVVKSPALSRILPASFVEKIDDIVLELGTKVDDVILKAGSKAESLLGKAASFLDDIALPLKIVYVAGRGVNAWGNAESILGITQEASVGQRCVAVLVAVINSLIPFIGDLIPDKTLVNILITILDKVGIDMGDIQEQREQAKLEVEQYNAENGTNLSIEQYNQMNGRAGIITKAKNRFKDGFGKAKDAFKAKKEESGSTLKAIGAGAMQAAKSLGGTFMNLANTIGNVTGVKPLMELANKGDIKGYITYGLTDIKDPMDALKTIPVQLTKMTLLPQAIGAFVGGAVTRMVKKTLNLASTFNQELERGVSLMRDPNATIDDVLNVSDSIDQDPENPTGKIMKAAIMGARIISIPVAVVRKFMEPITNFIKGMVDKVKGRLSADFETIKNLGSKVLEGDVSGLWETEVENPDEDPENIAAPSAWLAFQGAKLMLTPVTLLVKGGRAIGSTIGDFFNGFKQELSENKDAFVQYKDQLANAETMGETFSLIIKQPEYKGPLGGVFRLGSILTGVGYGVKSLFSAFFDSKLFNWFREKIGLVKEAGELLGERTGEHIDNIKTGVKSAIRKGLDYLHDYTSGGDSGFVSQLDPRYQGYSVSDSPFAAKGCGPAVAAMAAKAMGGRSLSVGEAVSASNGYQNPAGVTLDYFQNALGSKGINTQIIAGGGAGDIYNRVASGQPTILLGRDPSNTSKANSPFGPNNHYVLATGVDGRGNVIVNDPENRGPKSYSPGILRSVSYGITGSASGLRNSRANMLMRRLAGAGNPRNDEITQQVWAYLTTKLGMSEAAAAGVMGNMEQESGCRPDVSQVGGPAYGICQWEGGRKTALMQLPNYQNLSTQLDYFASELENPSVVMWGGSKDVYDKTDGTTYKQESTTYEGFKQYTDVAAATVKFEAAFERAGKIHMANRLQYAKAYYEMFTGKTYTLDPSIGTAAAPVGGVTSGTTGSTGAANATGANQGKSTSLLGIVSQIGSAFSNAFMGMFNPESSKNNSKDLTGVEDNNENNAANAMSTGGALSTSGSTVQGEMANGFPYYSQADSRWGSKPYGSHGTLQSSACGPTSMAMVLKSYGTNVTPEDTANWSAQHGFRAENGTAWGFFDAIGKESGLQVSQFEDAASAQQALNNNIPVIASMRAGDFTKGGHFIVLAGTKDGEILVNDPGKKARTHGWPASTVLSQAKQFWAISKDGKGSIGNVSDQSGTSTVPTSMLMAQQSAGYRPGNSVINTSGTSTAALLAQQQAAAGSGLLNYTQIARRSGGSSGILLGARPGTRLYDIATKISGGESDLLGSTTNMLTGLRNSVIGSSIDTSKGISPELVGKLIESITDVLNKIADNTTPIEKIYNALTAYLQSGAAGGVAGGDSGTDEVKVKKGGKVQIKGSVTPPSTVDSSISTLVGVLAELAKG